MTDTNTFGKRTGEEGLTRHTRAVSDKYRRKMEEQAAFEGLFAARSADKVKRKRKGKTKNG